MTAERIRAAAEKVRGKHLPLMDDDACDCDDPGPDLSEPLATLLDRMGDSIAQVEHLFDPTELEMPEYVALLTLVEAIEGAG